MALLTPLDPAAMLGGLPDTFSFADTFTPEIQHIEEQLSPLDDYVTIAAALTIADLFGEVDSIGSDLDGMISDFDTYDYSAPFAPFEGSTSEIDGSLGVGLAKTNSVFSANQAIAISIPGVNGIAITPPGQQSTAPPVLPPVTSTTPTQTAGPGASVTLQVHGTPAPPNYSNVGMSFTVTVTGTPGQVVYVVAIKNGSKNGQAAMGTIPVTGVLQVNGTWNAADIGFWVENWYEGSKFIGQLTVDVK